MQYRQGDVFLESVDVDVSKMEREKIENGKIILAFGEVTGHHHRFESGNVQMFVANDNKKSRRFIVVSERPAALYHEEHATIEVPPGIYEIFIQREWSDDEEPIQVKD